MTEDKVYEFIEACFEDLEQAGNLLEADPELLHARTDDGETALHFLAVENQLEAVKWLAARGADVDPADAYETPLSEAAKLGYVEMVRFLLSQGASVDGAFGVHMSSILYEAVRSGRPEIVDMFVRHGADLFAVDSLGMTLLHEAAADDAKLEVTRYLLARELPVDPPHPFGMTPLIWAALHGVVETAKVLVGAGASLSHRDVRGRNAAQVARECDHAGLAQWLEHAQAEGSDV